MTLRVTHLGKTFPTRSGDLSILRGIDLQLDPGDALAVLGPSGSGKSTLLHILGTLDRPSTGTVKLSEQDPFGLGGKRPCSFSQSPYRVHLPGSPSPAAMFGPGKRPLAGSRRASRSGSP